MSVNTIIFATVEIMLLGAVGYSLYKFRVVNDLGLDVLAKLVINVFLPFFIIDQFIVNFSFTANPDWWIFPLMGVAIIVVGLVVSKLLCLIFNLNFKNEFTSLIAFQNSGYIPLIMVTTLFEGAVSDTLYLNIFLLLIGFNAAMWSVGVALVAGNGLKNINFKSLINAPFITMQVCLLLIFTGLNKYLPSVIFKPIDMLAACVLPLVMIVLGGNLARVKIGNISKEIVLVVIGKLIVLPLIGLSVVYWLKPDFYISFIIMIETAAPSAITPSIIARHYKVRENILNQGIFYTHTLCMITIPVFLYIYTKIGM